MKPILFVILIMLALGFITLGLFAAPPHRSSVSEPSRHLLFQTATTTPLTQVQIGILTADPSTVFAGSSAVVTITCQLTDPRVIPNSVNLQQVDTAGMPLGIVGNMTRNPANASFYSIQLTIDLPSPQVLYYRASAGYTGTLQRQYSRPLTLTIISIQTATWLSYVTHSAYRFQYPSNWVVTEADDGTVSISPPDVAQVLPIEQAAAITIGYERNPTGLTIAQYFNGQLGPDLYTDTSDISTVTVAAITSTKFVGLAAIPSDEVIVIPVTSAFLVLYTSVPDNILNAFLNSLNIP